MTEVSLPQGKLYGINQLTVYSVLVRLSSLQKSVTSLAFRQTSRLSTCVSSREIDFSLFRFSLNFVFAQFLWFFRFFSFFTTERERCSVSQCVCVCVYVWWKGVGRERRRVENGGLWLDNQPNLTCQQLASLSYSVLCSHMRIEPLLSFFSSFFDYCTEKIKWPVIRWIIEPN